MTGVTAEIAARHRDAAQSAEITQDGLRWSCGHSVDAHFREEAIACLAKGGASAPPDARPQWRVDPPRGSAMTQRSFDSYAEAEAYAMKCPAHTRIIYPPDAESPAAAPIDTESYESYIASYHGAKAPLTREEWDARRSNAVGVHTAIPLTPTPLSATDFCAEAARLVGGPRATTHGDLSLTFTNIAELWNGYWRIKCHVNDERLSTPFTAHDVGCMMELFKIARRFSGSFNPDDYVDAAGYAGCTGEIAAKEANNAT